MLRGIRITSANYNGEDSILMIKGCVSFTVRNMGTAKATIFDTIVIEPNQVLAFPNVADLPYAENSNLSFAAAGTKDLQIIKATVIKMKEPCGE